MDGTEIISNCLFTNSLNDSELLYHQPGLVGVRALAVSQPAGPASRATALFGLFAKKLLCKMKIAPFLSSRNLPAPS